MTGLGVLAPLPARGQERRRCPPACGRGATDRDLLTALGRIAFALTRCLGEIGRGLRTATALGVTGRVLRSATGHGGSVRDPLLVGEVGVTARSLQSPLPLS